MKSGGKNGGFVSHGAPDILLGPDPALLDWKTFLPDPHPVAIIVLSAHWMEEDLFWSTASHPETIHDFGGFPPLLYRIRYPASGAPTIAATLSDALKEKGQSTFSDPTRGLDHGVWIPLSTMNPEASIPVLPLSLSWNMGTQKMFSLGRNLYDVMDTDWYFLASGGVTHNLRKARTGQEIAPWARTFDEWVVNTMMESRWNDLMDYRKIAPDAARNHPTGEHFLPLLTFAGWASRAMEEHPGASLKPVRSGMRYSTISMTGFTLISPE